VLRDRIKSVDLKQEFDRYHRMVKRSRRRLTDRVYLDSLTGIKNRSFFDKIIEEYVRSERGFSLVFLDIDHFKEVNDSYGHQIGDEVLKAVAFIIQSSCRDTDLCARYGGEEFAIIFPDLDSVTAARIAQDIRLAIKSRAQEITGIPITISIGVAHHPSHAKNREEIIRAADSALYRSKEAGRDRVTVYEV
jgi:diguanylate cyclase (GGDEF)-like protein